MTKKQRKSSRAWCLGRRRGEKQGSAHRRLRRQLRKESRSALRAGDAVRAKEVLTRTKKALAAGAEIIGRAHGILSKIRRAAARGR